MGKQSEKERMMEGRGFNREARISTSNLLVIFAKNVRCCLIKENELMISLRDESADHEIPTLIKP